MNKILETVAAMETEIASIKAEAEAAQAKGVFSYARSKSIRKSALDIGKLSKDLRNISLETFKAQKGE